MALPPTIKAMASLISFPATARVPAALCKPCAKSEVDILIYEKEKNMNSRLTIELMEQLHFFDREMFDILKSHGIKNIQDLIDSNLDEWDLTQQRRLELEEAKLWYDFSHLEDNIEKMKKKRK